MTGLSISTSSSLDHADPLRLTFCPACDYWLEGLPPEGVCPECGYAYDQKFVIIRARPAEQRWRLRLGDAGEWVNLTLLILLLAGISVFILHERDAGLLALILFVLAVAGYSWLEWWLSGRVPLLLIWMAPDGIGLGSPLDPHALRRRRRLWFYLGYVVIALLLGPRYVGAAIGVATIFGFDHLRRYYRPPKVARPATDTRPALFAWDGLRRVELSHYVRDVFRLRAVQKDLDHRLIDVVFTATPEQAAALAVRPKAWIGEQFEV